MALKINYTPKQVKSFLETRFPETDWQPVIEVLPPVVWRSRWDTLSERTGLPFKRRYIQNLDSKGIGPASFAA